MDEKERAIKEAERLARVEEQVTGLRGDFTDFRKENADFRSEMRTMFSSIVQTYPTKDAVNSEFALRDQRINVIEERVSDLEKAREKDAETQVTRHDMKRGRKATVWAAVTGAVISGLVLGIIELCIALLPKR